MKRLFVLLFALIMVFGVFSISYASPDGDSGVASDITADSSFGDDSDTTLSGTINQTMDKMAENGRANTTGGSIKDPILGDDYVDPAAEFPNVSIDDLGDHVESKGMKIVSLLQRAGRIICIIGFVVCCILIIVGAIADRRLLSSSVIGCFIAGLMYMCITYGPQIVRMMGNFFLP